MSNTEIESAVAVFNNIRNDISAIYSDDDDFSLEEFCIKESSLDKVIVAIQEERMMCEASREAIKKRIDDLTERSNRYAIKADGLKRIIVRAMQETGCDKIVTPELTISRRKGAYSVSLTNKDEIPSEFKEIKQVEAIDQRKILEALKEGREVAGARLLQSPETIAVRSK